MFRGLESTYLFYLQVKFEILCYLISDQVSCLKAR